MAHADIIVPRGGENKVAIQLIVQHVHTQLQLVNRTNDSQTTYDLSIMFLLERIQIAWTIGSFLHWAANARLTTSITVHATN